MKAITFEDLLDYAAEQFYLLYGYDDPEEHEIPQFAADAWRRSMAAEIILAEFFMNAKRCGRAINSQEEARRMADGLICVTAYRNAEKYAERTGYWNGGIFEEKEAPKGFNTYGPTKPTNQAQATEWGVSIPDEHREPTDKRAEAVEQTRAAAMKAAASTADDQDDEINDDGFYSLPY